MKANRLFSPLAAALFSCCLALAGPRAIADDAADAKGRIRELQKQRLKAATTARDYLVKQFKDDDLATAVNTNGFINQMLEASRLVLQARLDLCDGKPDRIKAIEETIKEFEPIAALYEKHYKSGIVDATVPYQLAQAQLLEWKIVLEQTKQEADRP